VVARSRNRSSFCRSSRSCRKSGCFSTLVLLSRLTIGFSRCTTCIRLTYHEVSCEINMAGETTHLPLIFKAYLSYGHTTIFFQIRPWRIHNRDVVLLVTYKPVNLCACSYTIIHSNLFESWQFLQGFTKFEGYMKNIPSILFALVNCAQSFNNASGIFSQFSPSGSRT